MYAQCQGVRCTLYTLNFTCKLHVANRNGKVVLVIFTKEQKSELRYGEWAFKVTYIEKQTINVDA